MKKQIFIAALAALLMGFVTSSYGQNGVKVEGKKATASAGNKKVEVAGKKGGGMKIDKTGMKVQGKHGSGLTITNNKKKK